MPAVRLQAIALWLAVPWGAARARSAVEHRRADERTVLPPPAPGTCTATVNSTNSLSHLSLNHIVRVRGGVMRCQCLPALATGTPSCVQRR